ncbi:MAG TPA: DUF2149 domain-containing protein [Actinomycetota bacterium]|nr:DUF2149 domain-containing protein [Actinomycetota bacterium]
MKVGRRAHSRPDRAGDPLDGLVNLFDLAIVLSVAFLLAALASLKLTSLLGDKDVTVVARDANGAETIIQKHGNEVKVLHVTAEEATGSGVKLGTVYQLQDGRVVYVPDNPTAGPPTGPAISGPTGPTTTGPAVTGASAPPATSSPPTSGPSPPASPSPVA